MSTKKNDFSKLTPKQLGKMLSDESRVNRTSAAKQLVIVASKEPEDCVSVIGDLIGALETYEAYTKWECYRALSLLAELDAAKCSKAIEYAASDLLGETETLLCQYALLFLCRYGATSASASKVVWPYIREAIETFDGDINFDRMLAFVRYFAEGKINKNSKMELEALVKFDAKNAKGAIAFRCKAILAALKGKKISQKSRIVKPEDRVSAKDKKKSTKTAATKKDDAKSASKPTKAAGKSKAKTKKAGSKAATKTTKKAVKAANKTDKKATKAVSKKTSAKGTKKAAAKTAKATKKTAKATSTKTKKSAVKKAAAKKSVSKKATAKKQTPKAATKPKAKTVKAKAAKAKTTTKAKASAKKAKATKTKKSSKKNK